MMHGVLDRRGRLCYVLCYIVVGPRESALFNQFRCNYNSGLMAVKIGRIQGFSDRMNGRPAMTIARVSRKKWRNKSFWMAPQMM